MPIKRALISVSDKTGVVEFAKGLHELGVEIISTGGTMKISAKDSVYLLEIRLNIPEKAEKTKTH